jgi:hypothetical protein
MTYRQVSCSAFNESLGQSASGGMVIMESSSLSRRSASSVCSAMLASSACSAASPGSTRSSDSILDTVVMATDNAGSHARSRGSSPRTTIVDMREARRYLRRTPDSPTPAPAALGCRLFEAAACSKNDRVKIAYVARELHYDGIKHAALSLTRHLSSENDVEVCGAIVPPDSPLLGGHLRDELMTSDALDSVDVVYMEGGWNTPAHMPARFHLEIAEAYVRDGGQLVVADVGRDIVEAQRKSLWAARDLLGVDVSFGEVQGYEGVRYLNDESVREHYEFRFRTADMVVSDWLKPALLGIDTILTSGPVVLVPFDGVAASAHATTNALVRDIIVERGIKAPWASANRHGRGHAVLIGAGVSYDYLLEDCPDNARWLSNLMAVLLDRSRESAGWSVRKSDSCRQDAAFFISLLKQPESQSLERKTSFLVPRNPDVPRHVIQHAVVKNVAALANTDGGHIIVGQADDLTVVGLENDFAQVKSPGRDGFELALGQYVRDVLSPGWAPLGLRMHWLEHDGLDVAIVEVPKSKVPVYLTDKKNKDEEAVYVRSGTRSDELTGRELVAWIEAGRSR